MIRFLTLAPLLLLACEAAPTAPPPESCPFQFVDRGQDCQDWDLNLDGSCFATCYPLYSDSARCPVEALPKSSPIQPMSRMQYVQEDGSMSYAYRGPAYRLDLPAGSAHCRWLEVGE